MKNHNIPFDSTGAVRLAPKQGKPEKPRNTELQQELIQICLNCTKKVCHGCDRDMRFKKQRRIKDEELP